MNTSKYIIAVITVLCILNSAQAAPDCINPIMGQGDIELEDVIVNGAAPVDVDSTDISITATGNLQAGGEPPQINLPAFPRNNAKNDTKASVIPEGSYDKVTVEDTTVFTGGTYYIDDLDIKKDATAIFAPGDYFVDKVEIDKGGKLIINPAGEVRFFISDKFKLDRDAAVNLAGSAGDLQVYLYGDAKFETKKNTAFTGLIYSNSPDSEIKLDGPTEINGGIITAGEIEGEDGLVLNLDDSILDAFGPDITICGEGFDHFVINHDGFGINCQIESIAVSPVDALGAPFAGYSGVIILNTGSGRGSWVATTGDNLVSDAILDDGIAQYKFSGNETLPVVFSLDYKAGPGLINVDVFDAVTRTLRDDDTEGNMRFGPSGFILTETELPTPPSVLIPFSAPQVAGTEFPLYVAAYGQTPGDPTCGIIESYTGMKDLKLWFDFVDPSMGSRQLMIDNNPIGNIEAGASNQTVLFTNGQAEIRGKYKDVGRIQLSVKDDTVVDPDLPGGIRGATAQFVVKPHHFRLAGIADGAGSPNPAAASAGGPPFIAAGDPFTATVTVFDAENDITPNYGRESSPETVRLIADLVEPVAGNNPPVTAAAGFGPFVAGQATGNDFIWPEVGIVTLQPAVGDGNYFDAGDVVGYGTGNVGRFIPHHFTTSLNSPSFVTGCASGSFTYIGDSFDYSVAPVITVTARAAAGTTTQNYAGDFFRITNSSLINRVYSAAAGTIDSSGLPPSTSDPAPVALGGGKGTLTFSSGTGLAFTRTIPEPVFTATIKLSIDVIDKDGVTAVDNPVTFGDPGGIAFDSGAEQRYGRIRLINSLGSELINLNTPMRAEYFLNDASGFVTNNLDSCTAGVSLSFGGYTEALSSGETCVLDTGSPGGSGSGCPAAGPFALQFRAPPLGGDFNLYLKAPGAGNNGSLQVIADVPAWLKFDWDSGSAGLENPTGTATFGIFDGDSRQIYMREVY